MSSHSDHGGESPPLPVVSQLLHELVLPLEAAINLLYLIRVTESDATARNRFVALAEAQLQEIAQIMAKYTLSSSPPM
jgi:hypothetical protein